MATTLRPGTASDADLLARHRRRMWEDMGRLPAGAADPSEPAYHAWLAREMAAGRLAAFVAQRDGTVAGTCCVWLQPVQPRPHLPREACPYVLSMFVEPAHRRAGVARALLEACVAWGRKQGYTRIALHASDAGRPLYAAMGFRPSSEMWLDPSP